MNNHHKLPSLSFVVQPFRKIGLSVKLLENPESLGEGVRD